VITVIITLKCIGSECGREFLPPFKTTPATNNDMNLPLESALGDDLSVLLEWTHEGSLFLDGLETTVTHFGSSVDEFQVDVLQSGTAGLLEKRFSQGDSSLLWSHNTTLDHDEIRFDKTVVNEATDWID